MNRKQQVIVILVLGALSTISPFAIDMYLPGFPAIADDLKTSVATVQLSLTSYFVGIEQGNFYTVLCLIGSAERCHYTQA